jgi:hypothetical protein
LPSGADLTGEEKPRQAGLMQIPLCVSHTPVLVQSVENPRLAACSGESPGLVSLAFVVLCSIVLLPHFALNVDFGLHYFKANAPWDI